ncbi:MAG: hypothetical protein BHW39_03035 [Firmicutes bacterium CAG:552_39_19]|nr:MAG: hypothetical protein BHW39_03035 [Firmicutes bacterium CAG:552_39_19]
MLQIYDAWGNHRIYDGSALIYDSATGVIAAGYENHIAILNPIRYRGYYYEDETQLFYCNSRYYSPELCRWISPDNVGYLDTESINGLNLYCYCHNNPIMYVDPSGHAFIAALLISIGIATLIGGATAGYSAFQFGERGWDLVANIVEGAIFGAAVGATIALGGAAGLAATGASVAGFGLSTVAALGISIGATTVAGMAKYSFDCVASNENNWNFGGFVLSGVKGALQGAVTFGIALLGGKMGLFNKIGTQGPYEALYNSIGRNIVQNVILATKALIGETMAKALFVSGSSAILRFLINMIMLELF